MSARVHIGLVFGALLAWVVYLRVTDPPQHSEPVAPVFGQDGAAPTVGLDQTLQEHMAATPVGPGSAGSPPAGNNGRIDVGRGFESPAQPPTPSWRPTRETFLRTWAETWVRPAEEMTVEEARELGFEIEGAPERTLAEVNWGEVPDQVFADAWDREPDVRRLFRANDLMNWASRGKDDLESARTIQEELARAIAALCRDPRVATYVEITITEMSNGLPD